MSVWWKIDYTRSQDKDVSQLQVREREREMYVVLMVQVIQNIIIFFLFCVLYKLKMVQPCSIEMNLPMCTNISYDTESGFLLFKAQI